jgi:outer membrane protein TolC
VPSFDTPINSISGFNSALSARISQPLLQLQRIGLIIEQHRIEQEMAAQRLRSQKQGVVKEVKEQYYDLLKTQSALEANEESMAFYSELSRLVHRYVQQNVALAYEAMETDARLARSEFDARKERDALATQSERLNATLGRDPRTRFRVTGVSKVPQLEPTPAAAESTALSQRPEMQEAQLKLSHAETGYQISRSGNLPELNLSMRYSRLFNVDLIPDEEWAVGLELRWEFYDWGRRSQDLAARNAAVAQARNQVRDAEAQVLVEVDARLRELEQAQALVPVTELTVKAAREKLRVLGNQYREQSALLKDLLQAESELADAHEENQRAVLSLWTAQANLDKALGED